MTKKELKGLIEHIHQLWYSNWDEDPAVALKLHRHMEALFNFADIKSTLIEKNPGEISPTQFAKMMGIKE